VSTGEATLKEVLLLLASSEDKFDRRAAASNRLASYDVLARLSCDIDFEVLSALLDNESCPMDLKASVAVRIADSPRLDAKVFAANRPETPTAALGRLAQSDDETILVGVVANASTSNELRIELLKKLWKSNNVLIRQAVASNASTPEPILLSMAARDFWPVRASAISNPCFPEKLRAKARDSLKQEVLKSLEPPRPLAAEELRPEHFHEPLMVLGLMPPLDEKNAVSKAVKAKDWVQRAAACLSPSISESALKRLLDDEVEMVKELAVWRLQEASKTA
jgi:hypothetical protein